MLYRILDRRGHFTEVIDYAYDDLGIGVRLLTDEAGAWFSPADIPAFVGTLWAVAQQTSHDTDQVPCPSPLCASCTADVRLAESERQGELARRTPNPHGVLAEIHAERRRQDEKFGEQNHPDGTGLPIYQGSAKRYRDQAQRAAASGHLKWRDVLQEEVYEALAEADAGALRAELVQVAAVAVAWIEAIDRRLGRRAEDTSARMQDWVIASGVFDDDEPAAEALAAVNDGPLVEQLPAELLHEAAEAIAAEAERGPKAGLTRIYLRGHANRLRLLADERAAEEADRRRWDNVPYAASGHPLTVDQIAAVKASGILDELDAGTHVTALHVNQAITRLRQAARTAPEGQTS